MQIRRTGFFLIGIFCLIFNSYAQNIYLGNKIHFTRSEEEESYHLFNQKENPSCRIKIRFFYPDSYSDPAILKKVQTIFAEDFFGAGHLSASFPISQLAKKQANQYINEYKKAFAESGISKKEMGEVRRSDEQQFTEEYNYDQIKEMRNTILFNRGNVLSQVINVYEYGGGPHGSTTTQGMIIDLNTGEKLHYEDIFKPGSERKISSLLMFALQHSDKYTSKQKLSDTGFNADMIPITNNLVADEDGITFIYNTYELGSYILGIVEIPLPYSEIVSFIREDGILFPWADKKRKDPEQVTYKTYTFNKSCIPAHYAQYEGFNGFHADIQFTFPASVPDEERLPEIQRLFIHNAFGEECASLSPDDAMNQFYSKTCEAYNQSMNEPNTLSYIKELLTGVPVHRKGYMLTTFSKEYTQRNRFHYYKNDLISYTIDIFRYEGGTRRIQTENPFTVRISTAKAVGYADLFTPNSRQNIANRMVIALLKAKGYASINDLKTEGYDLKKIRSSDQFYLSDAGITFVFQTAEIAPNPLGIQEITLTWREISPFLSDFGKTINPL
ncbi:MAG: DUF3298 and DUF4163 domain-containing protein [Dysgonamonadaceae bacterium]|jgi:hypothetical protein|nr:DUF3298 and DUF4163 domain-containing protein [Dysgonamonadaceae bacterium]